LGNELGVQVTATQHLLADRQLPETADTMALTQSDRTRGQRTPVVHRRREPAERFAGEFSDLYGLDGVTEDVLHEVTRRTPGFHAWQDPHWRVHCQDAAAFVGEVGYTELAAHPEALDQLRADMRLDGWTDKHQLEHFLSHLGHGATAMLFRCTVCGAHLAYADAS
jgi:uncharacterized protein CbrC (UPF0167 family)